MVFGRCHVFMKFQPWTRHWNKSLPGRRGPRPAGPPRGFLHPQLDQRRHEPSHLLLHAGEIPRGVQVQILHPFRDHLCNLFITGLPNKACPRLRDLATAPAQWSISWRTLVGLTLIWDVLPSCPDAQPVLPISHQPRQNRWWNSQYQSQRNRGSPGDGPTRSENLFHFPI